MLRLVLVPFALCCATAAQAQPNYIPDPNLRYILSELNDVVIDEDGYLVDPDVEYVSIVISTSADMEGVDLTGLEYLKTEMLTLSNESGGSFGAFPAFPQMLLQDVSNENGTYLLGFNGDEIPPLAENTVFFQIMAPVHIGSWTLSGVDDTITTIVELMSFTAEVPLPTVMERVDYVTINGWAQAALPTIGEAVGTLTVEQAPALQSLDLSPYTLGGFAAKYCDQLASLTLPTNVMTEITLEELPMLAELSTLPVTTNIFLQGLPALTGLTITDCESLTMWNMDCSLVGSWPASATYLNLSSTTSADLSELPDQLETLHMSGGIAPELPFLPSTLRDLQLIGTQVAELGALPSGLETLHLSGTALSCVPVLPESLTDVSTDLPCVPNQPPLAPPLNLCTMLNSYCPGANPTISGHVYTDVNDNGVQDEGEPDVVNATLRFLPTGHLTGTDTAGNYIIGLPIGTYTVSLIAGQGPQDVVEPGTLTVELPELGFIADSADLRIIPPPPPPPPPADLWIAGLHTYLPARNGFQRTIHFTPAQVSFTGTALVTIDVDPLEEIISTNFPTLSIEDNVITAVSALPLYHWQIKVRTGATVPLGTFVTTRVRISGLDEDPTPGNNERILVEEVIGSFDPNDKQVSPAALTPTEVAGDTLVEYHIRFQNTGTYHAERVVITDTLSTDLRWDTFRFLESSHSCEWYMADGVAHFIFNDIMLPDSTANEPESHGFVRFSIRPSTTLQQGESVTNIANIYFDFNEPVITDPCVLAVDMPTVMEEHMVHEATVFPNPTNNFLHVRLPATGTYTAEILAMDGCVVQTLGVVRTTVGIVVAGLPPGAYVLRLTAPGLVGSNVRFLKE